MTQSIFSNSSTTTKQLLFQRIWISVSCSNWTQKWLNENHIQHNHKIYCILWNLNVALSFYFQNNRKLLTEWSKVKSSVVNCSEVKWSEWVVVLLFRMFHFDIHGSYVLQHSVFSEYCFTWHMEFIVATIIRSYFMMGLFYISLSSFSASFSIVLLQFIIDRI